MTDHRPHQGFTLIELSIVLVTIGLVVGGVMVGRDLIKAADLRRVVTQVDSYRAAVQTFQLKYNEIPGDMPNATQWWPPDATCPAMNTDHAPKVETCDGNGDGVVGKESSTDSPLWPDQGELYRFWQHLANAGLIPGLFSGGSTGCCSDEIPGVTLPGLGRLGPADADGRVGVVGIQYAFQFGWGAVVTEKKAGSCWVRESRGSIWRTRCSPQSSPRRLT